MPLRRCLVRWLPAGAVILLFLLLNIEIADFYATGPAIVFRFGVTVSQDLTYTIGWLLFGMVLLGFCIYLRSHAGRVAALALDRGDDVQVLPVRSRVTRRPVPRGLVRRPRHGAGTRVARAAEVRARQARGVAVKRLGSSGACSRAWRHGAARAPKRRRRAPPLDPSAFTYSRADRRPVRPRWWSLPLDARGARAQSRPARPISRTCAIARRARTANCRTCWTQDGVDRDRRCRFSRCADPPSDLAVNDGHHRSTYLVTLPSAPLPDARSGRSRRPRGRSAATSRSSVERPADRRHRATAGRTSIAITRVAACRRDVAAAPPLVLPAGNRDDDRAAASRSTKGTTRRCRSRPSRAAAAELAACASIGRQARRCGCCTATATPCAPEYDLALLRTTVMEESAVEVTAGAGAAGDKRRRRRSCPPRVLGFPDRRRRGADRADRPAGYFAVF